MTIHLCDRCGKRLTSYFLEWSPRFQIRKTAERSSPFRYSRIWCDFCEDCSKEIEKWLEGEDYVLNGESGEV